MLHRPHRSDSGFTLIELLVVVIMIGILAAIAIPTFLGQREAAWRAQATTDMKHAVLAVETYVVGGNGRDYTDVNGFTESTPVLAGWGLNTTQWTTLEISAVDGADFCIEGKHQQLPQHELRYTKAEGRVVIGPIGTLSCP